MKIGLLVKGVFNPAVFLSVSRAVAALALLFLVPQEMWYWALAVFAWAVCSDIFDGGFANIWLHPWNGKMMNDIPSGILSFATPGSILLWLFMKHPDADSVWHSGWFWGWVGGSVIFGLGTLVFNNRKSPGRLIGTFGVGRQQALDSMVHAEVAQGWFYGLYMFAFGAQFWYMVVIERFGAQGNDWTSWVIYCASAVVTAMYAKDRMCDRPEVRKQYANDE
jgi:hypothetical protein